MSYLKLIEDFAREAHAGQKRKYTGEDYITHPIEVARLVKIHTEGDVEMQAAALLHDVIEDTDVTMEDLEFFLYDVLPAGRISRAYILNLVDALTDKYTKEAYPDMNRAERKAAEADRLAQEHPDAQTIKYCDLVHNTESIVKHDPKFAKLYLKEKWWLLEKMDKGHQGLRKALLETVKSSK